MYDVKSSLDLGSISVSLPFIPVIRDLTASLETFDRRADLKHLSVQVASLTSSHKGYFDFADEAAISTSLESVVAGEQLGFAAASYTRIEPGLHEFGARVERKPGALKSPSERQLAGKEIRYSDFRFRAGLMSAGSAVDILPLKLFPAGLSQKLDEYFSRVDMLGPLSVSTAFLCSR